jgi:hypothetical protein
MSGFVVLAAGVDGETRETEGRALADAVSCVVGEFFEKLLVAEDRLCGAGGFEGFGREILRG